MNCVKSGKPVIQDRHMEIQMHEIHKLGKNPLFSLVTIPTLAKDLIS